MPTIKKITSTDTFSVRHPVLRSGKPLESCHFDGDILATTSHYGLFLNQEINKNTSAIAADHQSSGVPKARTSCAQDDAPHPLGVS